MRCLRTATPVPQPPNFETVCLEISRSRRESLLSSEHLPTLNEGSLDCKVMKTTITPVFSSCEQGTTEITALVGSPSNLRRGQLLKSALERRRSHDNTRLPNLNTEHSPKEHIEPASRSLNASPVLPGCVEDVRSSHDKLARAFSHPVIPQASGPSSSLHASSTSSKSLPRLDGHDLPRRLYTAFDKAAILRQRLQQEEMEYDFMSSRAIILERFLSSQQMAKTV